MGRARRIPLCRGTLAEAQDAPYPALPLLALCLPKVCSGAADAVLVQCGRTARKEITVMARTPLTILCVDDSTADRTLYRHFLGSTGSYTFLEAATGEEGLRSCQTTQPDCLILDFYLPDMDGF